MFTPSRMLLNYLNAQPRDIYDVVGALMGYINADPQFKTHEFEQAVQYVLSHGVSKDEIFAPFNDEIDFEDDQAKWNEDYYSFARVYLKKNFCEQRINHVKAVARKLYPMALHLPNPSPGPVRQTEHSGGAQSGGKKTQSQQNQKSQLPATKLIIVVVVVVLALVIMALRT